MRKTEAGSGNRESWVCSLRQGGEDSEKVTLSRDVNKVTVQAGWRRAGGGTSSAVGTMSTEALRV